MLRWGDTKLLLIHSSYCHDGFAFDCESNAVAKTQFNRRIAASCTMPRI